MDRRNEAADESRQIAAAKIDSVAIAMPDEPKFSLTPEEIASFIERAAWRSAKSTEDVAPHQYIVKGWERDDISEEEFWGFVELVKATGREEVWTPPDEWVQRWGGRPMKNRYLYVGEYAYWFTWPRDSVPMLNREHVSVQEKAPTRRRVDA